MFVEQMPSRPLRDYQLERYSFNLAPRVVTRAPPLDQSNSCPADILCFRERVHEDQFVLSMEPK